MKATSFAIFLISFLTIALPAHAKEEDDTSQNEQTQPLGAFLDCGNENLTYYPENQRSCIKAMNKKFCGLFSKMPLDVQKFLDNEYMCYHLGGEEGSGDAEREKELKKSIEEYNCTAIQYQSLNLLRQYWGNKEVMHEILFFTNEWNDNFWNQCKKEPSVGAR